MLIRSSRFSSLGSNPSSISGLPPSLSATGSVGVEAWASVLSALLLLGDTRADLLGTPVADLCVDGFGGDPDRVEDPFAGLVGVESGGHVVVGAVRECRR